MRNYTNEEIKNVVNLWECGDNGEYAGMAAGYAMSNEDIELAKKYLADTEKGKAFAAWAELILNRRSSADGFLPASY